jgi:hypothetical protein
MSGRSTHSPRKNNERRKSKKRKNFIALLVVLLVLAAVLSYIGYSNNKEYGGARYVASNNEPFTTLENKDTLKNLARIELGKDGVSIMDISKVFYTDSIFWPYISMANNNINDPLKYNLLNLPKGTVLGIPKVRQELLDKNNAASVRRLNHIRDSIIFAIEEKRKPKSSDFFD